MLTDQFTQRQQVKPFVSMATVRNLDVRGLLAQETEKHISATQSYVDLFLLLFAG